MANLKTLYLHIGRAKTGTTSLQAALRANRDALQNDDYCYPVAGMNGPDAYSHARMALICQQSKPRQEQELMAIKERLELEVSSFKNVIISSEGFQNILDNKRINVLFNRENAAGRHGENIRYDLITVCYLREFLDYARSSYAQRVQSSNMFCYFDQFCSQFSNFNLASFMSFWESISDKTVFISYEAAASRPSGVIDDFRERIDLHTPLDDHRENHNVTISGNLLTFKLAVNKVAPHRPEYYRALMRLAHLEPRFRGAFHIDTAISNRLRTIYSKYNDVLESAVGEFPIKDFSGEPPLYDASTWRSDFEMFMEEPEFSALKNVRELWELNPLEWQLNERLIRRGSLFRSILRKLKL